MSDEGRGIAHVDDRLVGLLGFVIALAEKQHFPAAELDLVDHGRRRIPGHQLVEYLEQGNKPRADWRIGTEHEKFAYCLESFRPLPYEGERSIRAVLEALRPLGWEGIEKTRSIVRESIERASANR